VCNLNSLWLVGAVSGALFQTEIIPWITGLSSEQGSEDFLKFLVDSGAVETGDVRYLGKLPIIAIVNLR
jgi:hypothetical protein